jgi:hypothetical protein
MSEPNKSSNSFKGMLWEAQPGRNVFLQFDDRLGAPLSRLPREVLAPRLRKVRGRRVWFVGFAASLGGARRLQGARGVDATVGG